MCARVVGEPPDFPDLWPRKRGSDPAHRHARRRKREPTRAEERLAQILSDLSEGGEAFHFEREWAFYGKFILDFFVPDVRLGIEVDGPSHDTAKQRRIDREKESALEKLEVTLIRIRNAEVFGDAESLLARLRTGWKAALRGRRGLVEQ